MSANAEQDVLPKRANAVQHVLLTTANVVLPTRANVLQDMLLMRAV